MTPQLWDDFEVFSEVIIKSYHKHLTPLGCAMRLKNSGMPIPNEEITEDSDFIENLRQYLIEKLELKPEQDKSGLINL